MDKSRCSGCDNDFYNHGGVNGGTNRCWSLDSAKLIRVVELHVDDRPPFKPHKLKTQWKPSCYRKARYCYTSKDSFTSNGYWKS